MKKKFLDQLSSYMLTKMNLLVANKLSSLYVDGDSIIRASLFHFSASLRATVANKPIHLSGLLLQPPKDVTSATDEFDYPICACANGVSPI